MANPTPKTEFFTIQRYELLRRVAETEEGKAREGELETSCMFCLENFIETDDVAMMRGCFHVFHVPCISQYIERTFCKEVFLQWPDLPLEYDPDDPLRIPYKVFYFNVSAQCIVPGILPVSKKKFMGEILANVLHPIIQPLKLNPNLTLENIAELRYFEYVRPLYEANGYTVPAFERLPPDYDSLRAIEQQGPVEQIDPVALLRQQQQARRERRMEMFELGLPSAMDIGIVALLSHVAPALTTGAPFVLMSLIVPPILLFLNRYRHGLNPDQRSRHVTFMGVILILFIISLHLAGLLGAKQRKITFDMILRTVFGYKTLWEELPFLSDFDFIIRMKELIPSTLDAPLSNLFKKYTVKQLYSKLDAIITQSTVSTVVSTASNRKKKRDSKKRRSRRR